MADLCRTCAIRSQRSAVSAVRRQVQSRLFTASQAPRKNVSVPSFGDVSSPELDESLQQLRSKHFVPAYLNKRQRHLIFGDKFKQELENNPAYATVGDEEIQLNHIDRRKDIPARKPLVNDSLKLMKTPEDWRQLPQLLEGLHKSHADPNPDFQEKIIRKAIENGQIAAVIRSLRRAQATGLTLKNDAILNRTLWGLRETASTEDWDKSHLDRALRFSSDLAELLEAEEHGSARKLSPNDPRTRPTTIAQFLELHAVNVYKYQGASDAQGQVKAYAQRLMACFNETNQPTEQPLPEVGPPTEFYARLPIWHGLSLARAILGDQLPQAQQAGSIIQTYESRLSSLVETLQARKAGPKTYAGSAVAAWNSCIRP